MKIAVTDLRFIIKEELTDVEREQERQKVQYMMGAVEAKRPYLKGQWTKVRHDYKVHGRQGTASCWEADDPQIGRVYLSFSSHTSYKMTGRLRDPSGTRRTYSCVLSLHPFMSFSSYKDPSVFSVAVVGENRAKEEARETQISAKMMKLFGIDPFEWKKPKAPEPVTPEGPANSPVSPGNTKTYKIYGKLKGAPAHTRLKGKAYVAAADTRFKPGDSAVVEPKDGRLSVKDPTSGHTQEWEPATEGAIREMIELPLPDLEATIAAMDPDSMAGDDYIDSDTGEIYLEKDRHARTSQLHPEYVQDRSKKMASDEAARLADEEQWATEDVAYEAEQDRLREEAQEAFEASIRDFASNWSSFTKESPDTDPQDAASDAAEGFFYDYPEWRKWAKLLGMDQSSVKGSVVDHVYEAMISGS